MGLKNVVNDNWFLNNSEHSANGLEVRITANVVERVQDFYLNINFMCDFCLTDLKKSNKNKVENDFYIYKIHLYEPISN